MAVNADYLDTKAAEVVGRLLPRLSPGSQAYGDFSAYVRAVLDLTECRGAMRGAREFGEAMMEEKL